MVNGGFGSWRLYKVAVYFEMTNGRLQVVGYMVLDSFLLCMRCSVGVVYKGHEGMDGMHISS